MDAMVAELKGNKTFQDRHEARQQGQALESIQESANVTPQGSAKPAGEVDVVESIDGFAVVQDLREDKDVRVEGVHPADLGRSPFDEDEVLPSILLYNVSPRA